MAPMPVQSQPFRHLLRSFTALCSWHVLGYIWFMRSSGHEVGDFSYLNSLFGMGDMGPVTGTFCENSFTVLEPNLLLSR